MPEHQISDLFSIPNRFLRSAHLERDFADPRALEGYILTEPMRRALGRIVEGLRPESGHRAWRITGDYGTGKSSFGLLLAHLLAGRSARLPSSLQQALDFRLLGLSKPPNLLPLLVTGSREGLAVALAHAILAAIEELRGTGRIPAQLVRIKQKLDIAELTDVGVVRALADLNAYVIENAVATGLVVILDELGKFLEFAALNPEADVYLLQRLAEAAARSAERPLVLVGLLHQGFHAYAEQLVAAAQQEWEKVAGRFEEIVFEQPFEHVSVLAAGALNVSQDDLGKKVTEAAKRSMRNAIKLGWYGSAADERALIACAPRLYPLHPLVLPPLIRFLRRFGQHERSLFSFLLSTEPFGLQDFASRPCGPDEAYRVHNLYDYVRATFGHLLGGQSHRSQWLRISTMIDSTRGEEPLALQVLKTVGLLNLLDADDLIASTTAVIAAIEPADADTVARVTAHIDDLKRRHILYDRGAAGGLCLWPHTSVNLDKALDDAERALGSVTRVSSWLSAHLDARPLVARRHHITTGTLRHFAVRFIPVSELRRDQVTTPDDADGAVIVLLCDNSAEHDEALQFAKSETLHEHANILVAVSKPLRNLDMAVQQARCWQWVIQHTGELNHDSYAAAEAARQLGAARRNLRQRLDQFVRLHGPTTAPSLKWFHAGASIPVRDGRQLIELLSTMCDGVFERAPRITNELVNRRALSSAGAKARQVLIERMLDSSSLPTLALDADRAPPEKSIYLSVLRRGGVHRRLGETYALLEPEREHDECKLRPALACIRGLLEAQADGRVSISSVFATLRKAPYGVRDGILPILLAIYLKAHEHELAFYENGSFIIQIGGAELQRMMKAPATFEMQLCQVVGVRAELFDQLLTLLDVAVPAERKPALLDIVTPLCTFAARLPEYALKTSALSDAARAVRSALKDAREPVKLLFRDLPVACGVAPFPPGDTIDDDGVQIFVRALRGTLDELRSAYGDLQARNETMLFASLDVTSTPAAARQLLSRRARCALLTIHEPRLKAFCLRLCDDNLVYDRWMESIASLVVSKPPSRWSDADVRTYADELTKLAETFRRVESVAFAADPTVDITSAVRVVMTRADGAEVARVVHMTDADEHAVAELETRISAILTDSRGLGLAATSRVFWKALAQGVS